MKLGTTYKHSKPCPCGNKEARVIVANGIEENITTGEIIILGKERICSLSNSICLPSTCQFCLKERGKKEKVVFKYVERCPRRKPNVKVYITKTLEEDKVTGKISVYEEKRICGLSGLICRPSKCLFSANS